MRLPGQPLEPQRVHAVVLDAEHVPGVLVTSTRPARGAVGRGSSTRRSCETYACTEAMAAAGAHPATAGRSAGLPGRHAGPPPPGSPAACAAAARPGSISRPSSVHPESAAAQRNAGGPHRSSRAPVGTHAPSLATPPILSAGWPRRCPRVTRATAAARNADGRRSGPRCRQRRNRPRPAAKHRLRPAARRRAPARTPPPAATSRRWRAAGYPGLVGARTWSRRCRPAARSRPGSRSGRRPAATGGADGGSVRSMRTSTPRRRTRSATCRGPVGTSRSSAATSCAPAGPAHRTSSGGVAGSRPLLASTRRASPGRLGRDVDASWAARPGRLHR